MLGLVVLVSEFVAEVVIATVMEFVSEVLVGWVAEMAHSAIAEWLSVAVAHINQLFVGLFAPTRP